jgi:hypothetical protein
LLASQPLAFHLLPGLDLSQSIRYHGNKLKKLSDKDGKSKKNRFANSQNR